MVARVLSAVLALIAAVAIAGAVAVTSWWAGSPTVEGHLVRGKTADITVFALRGCDTKGLGRCQERAHLDEAPAVFAASGAAAAGLAGLAALTALVMAGLGLAGRWRGRRVMAWLSRVAVVLAAGAAVAFTLTLPERYAAYQLPLGLAPILLGAGLGLAMLASAIGRRAAVPRVAVSPPPPVATDDHFARMRNEVLRQHAAAGAPLPDAGAVAYAAPEPAERADPTDVGLSAGAAPAWATPAPAPAQPPGNVGSSLPGPAIVLGADLGPGPGELAPGLRPMYELGGPPMAAPASAAPMTRSPARSTGPQPLVAPPPASSIGALPPLFGDGLRSRFDEAPPVAAPAPQANRTDEVEVDDVIEGDFGAGPDDDDFEDDLDDDEVIEPPLPQEDTQAPVPRRSPLAQTLHLPPPPASPPRPAGPTAPPPPFRAGKATPVPTASPGAPTLALSVPARVAGPAAGRASSDDLDEAMTLQREEAPAIAGPHPRPTASPSAPTISLPPPIAPTISLPPPIAPTPAAPTLPAPALAPAPPKAAPPPRPVPAGAIPLPPLAPVLPPLASPIPRAAARALAPPTTPPPPVLRAGPDATTAAADGDGDGDSFDGTATLPFDRDGTDPSLQLSTMLATKPAPAPPRAAADLAPPFVPLTTAAPDLPAPTSQQLHPGGPAPACPQCDAPMAWVEAHLRFFCASCRMYF